MPLTPVVDSIDAVPEALREHYTEKDGKFHLSVDGMVPKDRLDEFRNNNIEARRALDEMKARYEGVDLDKYRELTDKEAKLRDKRLLEAGKVEELLAERVNGMKSEHEKVLKDIAGERDTLKRQLEGLVIDGSLRDAAIKAGVRSTAVDDVLLAGRQIFRLDSGKAVAFDGDKPMWGKSSEPLTAEEWLSGMAERKPHWFDSATGTGATKAAPGSSGQKTMTREQFEALSPTEKVAAIKSVTITN